MLLISELKQDINNDDEMILKKVAKQLRIDLKDIKSYRLKSKSIDARKNLMHNYQVLIEIDNEDKYLKYKNVSKYKVPDTSTIRIDSDIRPIIVGYGPSDLFACLRLVEAGLKPIVFEQGPRIFKREKDVERFFKEGILNPLSNVQFGEGGAGTFSDAKLTTRVKDVFVDYILDTFIKYGANEDIAYKAHAHIGTDEIRKIITNITDDLILQGVDFHFEEAVKDFIIEENKIKAVITDKNTYYSDYVLLGIGHSAYKTINALKDRGVFIEKKDMAIGFRVEHPQSFIDNNRYKGNKNPKLEPSEYFLRYNDEKAVYSFCMCPGGFVVPSNSEEKRVVTNGMSYSKRDNHLANSALLLQVSKDEFENGFEFIKTYEEKAYKISDSYCALACNIKDYLNDELNPLIFESSYCLGTTLYDFNKFFPKEYNDYFKKAFYHFERIIPGFIENGIMVGPETRSSSPVRVKRDIELESINTKGLYPMGEGCGYGGGIISCSLDGIRIANAIINKIKNSL